MRIRSLEQDHTRRMNYRYAQWDVEVVKLQNKLLEQSDLSVLAYHDSLKYIKFRAVKDYHLLGPIELDSVKVRTNAASSSTEIDSS